MDIIEFINKFKSRFNDEKEVENVFNNGYCYHFAIILAHLFGNGNCSNHLMYNPVDNHFAFLGNDYQLYDISGNIGTIDNNWVNWEKYKKLDKLETNRIIKQCIYKIYEEEE